MPASSAPSWLAFAGSALSALGTTFNGINSLYGVSEQIDAFLPAANSIATAAASGAVALTSGWVTAAKVGSVTSLTAASTGLSTMLGLGAGCLYASAGFLWFLWSVARINAESPPLHAPRDGTADYKRYPRPDWLNTTVLNWGVMGRVGVGKSTLINSLRGLQARCSDAAPVGVGHTTKSPTPYTFVGPFAQYTDAQLWDIPGAGTREWPAATYIRDLGLRHFDGIVLVIAGAFTEAEEQLMQELIQFQVPYYIVRNKVDQDVTNNLEDNDIGVEETLAEIREELKSWGCNLERSYLISAKHPDRSDFHFGALLKAMANDARMQRGELSNLLPIGLRPMPPASGSTSTSASSSTPPGPGPCQATPAACTSASASSRAVSMPVPSTNGAAQEGADPSPSASSSSSPSTSPRASSRAVAREERRPPASSRPKRRPEHLESARPARRREGSSPPDRRLEPASSPDSQQRGRAQQHQHQKQQPLRQEQRQQQQQKRQQRQKPPQQATAPTATRSLARGGGRGDGSAAATANRRNIARNQDHDQDQCQGQGRPGAGAGGSDDNHDQETPGQRSLSLPRERRRSSGSMKGPASASGAAPSASSSSRGAGPMQGGSAPKGRQRIPLEVSCPLAPQDVRGPLEAGPVAPGTQGRTSACQAPMSKSGSGPMPSSDREPRSNPRGTVRAGHINRGFCPDTTMFSQSHPADGFSPPPGLNPPLGVFSQHQPLPGQFPSFHHDLLRHPAQFHHQHLHSFQPQMPASEWQASPELHFAHQYRTSNFWEGGEPDHDQAAGPVGCAGSS